MGNSAIFGADLRAESMEKFGFQGGGLRRAPEKSNNRPSAAGWRAFFAAASNFHPTLGYAPPQPHLGIRLDGPAAGAGTLLQAAAWVRALSRISTSDIKGKRTGSEDWSKTFFSPRTPLAVPVLPAHQL